MEAHGLQEHQVLHILSMKLPTEIASLLQWEITKPFSHPLMVPHGPQGILGIQNIYMELPMGTVDL